MFQIGAQLYTIRDYTKTAEGFENSLGLIHEIGYEGVQLSAVGCMDSGEVSAEAARELLDSNGLVCCATHRPWARLRDFTDEEIDFHQVLGCDYVAIGGIFDGNYEGWLEELPPVLAALKEAGISFGYHNHAQEFAKSPSGELWFDVLAERGGDDLMLEIDTYWVQHAGVDPAKCIARFPYRVPVIHVKDKEVIPGEGPVYAPVGEGNLDWEAILTASEESEVEWLVVEQDTCRRDPFECLRSSYDFLSARLSEREY